MTAVRAASRNQDDLIEGRLAAAIPSVETEPDPLHLAMRYAVLSPGKRLRPRLLLCVADSCREDSSRVDPELVLNAACAVELLHCASLVHDDLPCFDDATLRRGLPTVHIRFGEPMALLVGDALLIRAFELVSAVTPSVPERALRILALLAKAAGSREGLIGGQSMELGALVGSVEQLERYHTMKTAALFRLAAEAGAIAAGVRETAPWASIGSQLGLALQLADDLIDVQGESERAGKSVRRDAALRRPNAVLLGGAVAARAKLDHLLAETRHLVLACARNPRPLLALLDRFITQVWLPQSASTEARRAPR